MRFFKYILFFMILAIPLLGKAQLSKTHYIPPLTSAEFGNANPEDQYIYLSTPSAADISYTIIPVGQPTTSYITGVISNTTPREIFVGNGSSQLFMTSSATSTVTSNKGYIVEAEDVIYVSVRMQAGGGAQAGALVSKGLSALGTTFRVGSFTNENASDNYLNFVSVMATEDNTEVVFSDLPAGLSIKNYSGTTPITITLNEGQSYTIATNSSESVINKDGLIGTLVKSDKNIVVNCGSANGSFHNGGGRDYGLDQIVDLSKVGKEYIFVRGDGSDNWENILIVAHTNNTTISINGGGTVATINAGEYYLIEGDNYNGSGNMFVQTSEDVFAYQGIGGGGEANQGLFFVPPLNCETRGNLDNIANIEDIGSTVYTGGISIVTKVGATVTINNSPLSSFSTIGPNTVNGNSDYITYKVSGLTGSVSVQSNDELYCAYFNYNGAATSGSFYSGFPSNPEINFDAAFVTLGNCIPNVDLTVANAGNFDSFSWYFDDGSGTGFVDLMNSNSTITPTNPGKYKLIGTITCSGLTLESVEVPVSICPDDIDNDGIIDNIDIDNDNDGILNCTESKGDVTMNLTNLNSPQFIYQDSTTDTTIASGTYTESSSTGTSNTFTGTNSGNFTSSLSAATNAENDYTMTFSELVNVKFSENSSIIHSSVDGEYFIAKISPVNKNITLVDPDDRLLVDSNFDGAFETGITSISGSEIHFKINPAATGTTPYEFFANKVDGFTFKHILANINNSSSFQGIISLTCFKLDSDGDGIQDALDYDSDNDGIPDIIENKGEIIVLSNVDADGDGLDDIFNTSDLPLDSDTDGVYDFLDLDSDNDGIYDLEESNNNLLDVDLDGIIDDANLKIGLNGWVDDAETTPDSGLIGYIVPDTDSDALLNYLDIDSDGDICFDGIEAGFSDVNSEGLLGTGSNLVDLKGLVTSATDGYTIPNNDYLIFAPILIETQPENTESCELSITIISVNSSTAETYQWEVSIDGGTNWATIIDDAIYSNSQTNTLQITTTPLIYNTYKYRSFLNRTGNTCGLYTDEITLTVIRLPIAGIAPTIQLCDDDNNGTMPFDLTTQNLFINTVAGMTISYHPTLNDADLNLNPILVPYESGNTTIFARLENDLNTSCYDVSNFNLEVYESPFPLDSASITNLSICDNTSVGTDIDGFATFDLTQRETEILNGQLASDFTLTYFTDSNYLVSSQILTPNSFPNGIADGQTIYVRMTNNLNTICFTDTSFEIEIYKLPVVNSPNIYTQCDDSTNDGQALFNLTLNSIKEEINPNYISEGLTFTYFETQVDAETNNSAIPNPDSYLDQLGFTNETIWIRVENPNGCFRVETIELEVSPSSAALATYNPTSLYQCDDGSDLRDAISTFDLTNIHDHIESNIFPTFNVSVHFYESLSDAELENNEISNIANHQNTNSPNIQDIWVRVKSDLGNNCLGLEEFAGLLNVEALPIAFAPATLIECDDNQDGVFVFDTSNVESTILNTQSLANVSISYFDAAWNPLLDYNGTPINSPFPNSFETTSQTIYYTLTNRNTNDPDGACFESNFLEFIVDVLPINNTVIIPPICDPDPDDGVLIGTFDTTTLESSIGAQTGMDIVYYDAAMNPLVDADGNTITSPFPSSFNSGTQTINIVVTNPINTACPITNTIDFVVNALPEFSVEESRIICESGANSTITLDVIQDNSSEVLDYEWTDENGAFISNAQSIDITSSGIYTVTLFKTNGTGCPRSKEITAVYSEKANLDYDDITIVDDSNNNSIAINNDNQNLGKGDYEFSLDEFGPYQDAPVFNNLLPGIYTLYARDKNACGTSEIEVSVVGFPKFFSPNNDGKNDKWQVLGINKNFYSSSTIYIYDRFGKIIAKVDPLSEGWNGYYNGTMLPSDDYWFSTILTDNDGNERVRKGHFSLIRR